MAIDKESSGMPQVDVRKRTTKVNLSIILAVGVFFAAMAAVFVWMTGGAAD